MSLIVIWQYPWNVSSKVVKYDPPYFSNLAKSLNILGIWPNPWVKQGFGQIAERFRDLAKSLVWQSYCNIYIYR